ALRPAGNIHVPAKLPLEHAVIAFHFLFFAKPRAIIAELAALDGMHAGLLIATALDGALRRVAAQRLQKEFYAFPAAQAANRTCVASHVRIVSVKYLKGSG